MQHNIQHLLTLVNISQIHNMGLQYTTWVFVGNADFTSNNICQFIKLIFLAAM